MLKLILGAAGTGKTGKIYDYIKESVAAGRKATLIVPEQFSFESECALYELLGESEFQSVQVLSFTRLCHKIFYKFGGCATRTLDLPAKTMLMSLAVIELQDSLLCYGAQVKKSSFGGLMLSSVEELSNAGITPGDLRAAGELSENEFLRNKTADLSLIYEAYLALLEKSGRDSMGSLVQAVKLIRGKQYFEATDVFIDGFTALMAPEWGMVGEIFNSCRSLTAALTATGLSQNEQSPLAIPAKTAAKLVSLARERSIEVALVRMDKSLRAENEAIDYLYNNLFTSTEPFKGPQEAVRVFRAANRYVEVEEIAKSIRELVDVKSYRYREIAAIFRSLEPYQRIVSEVFSRYKIPINLDRRESAENMPLCSLIILALLAVKSGFETRHMLSLLKLPILSILEEDSFLLENYCYVWNVRGSLWNREFSENPDGIDTPITEDGKRRLMRIEAAREKLVAPLLSLKRAVSAGSGKAFAKGVYGYLTESGAIKKLDELTGVSPEREYLDIQSALYEEIIAILDNFYDIIGDRVLDLGRFIELFTVSVRAADAGKLPQVIDSVAVGTADKIRPVGIKAAFLAGAAAGEFPLENDRQGILSDIEREELNTYGMELDLSLGSKRQLERFYAYFAATVPSERLMISFPGNTLSGEPLRESELVTAALGLFSGAFGSFAENGAYSGLASRENALLWLSRHYYEDTPLRATLLQYFSGSGELHSIESAIKYSSDKDFKISDRAVSEGLFGLDMTLSPSKIERYHGCAFSYFCDGALRLKTRRRVEFSPVDSGSLIHYVMECMVKKYCTGKNKLPSEPALREELSELISYYLGERIGDIKALPKRFIYLYRRLIGLLCRLVRHTYDEFLNSDFVPAAFELCIDHQSENRPITLFTGGGVSVSVRGVVDRVDVLNTENGRYIRVVDYKSGLKQFSLSDVYYGLNLQMLIYLFTVSQNGRGELSGAAPAGVLYMPAKERVILVDKGESKEKIASEHEREFKMNGLLLNDISVLSKMEHGVLGNYIPARLKKDGSLDVHSAVASAEEFGKIRKHIEKMVEGMADSLVSGAVGAVPLNSSAFDPCGWCDYKYICRRGSGSPCRKMQSMDSGRAMDEIEKADSAL